MLKYVFPDNLDASRSNFHYLDRLKENCSLHRVDVDKAPLALRAIKYSTALYSNASRRAVQHMVPSWLKLLDAQIGSLYSSDNHIDKADYEDISNVLGRHVVAWDWRFDLFHTVRKTFRNVEHLPFGLVGFATGKVVPFPEYTQQDLDQLGYEIQKFFRDRRLALADANSDPRLRRMQLMLLSVHIDGNSPTVVNYIDTDENPMTADLSTVKVKSMRISKFLRMLVQKFGWKFTDDEIQEVSEWCGENLRTPEYLMEVVEGADISRTYREEYFGSCMHDSGAVYFYDEQPNVKLLRIEDKRKGTLIGRALIWEDVRDVHGKTHTVLDRVYPSDGGAHIKAAMNWAKKQGWIYKVEHRIDGALSTDLSLYVEVRDTGDYPYMDTFGWSGDPYDGGKVQLDNAGHGAYEWRSTENVAPWDEGKCGCPDCGDVVYADDMVYIESSDTYVCDNCATYNYSECEDSNTLYPNDEIVEIVNGDNISQVWRDHDYLVQLDNGDFALYDTYHRFHRLDWYPVELHNGELAHPDNAVEIDGDWYHKDNDADIIAELTAEEEEED